MIYENTSKNVWFEDRKKTTLAHAHCNPSCFHSGPLNMLWNHLLFKLNNWQQQHKELTWGSIPAGPKQRRGHAGHRLGPGHSWLMQLGLSGKWLSKQGPEWLPLTGTSALSPLIHSKEPQSNTQRHTVTSNNTAVWGDTKWIPLVKAGRRTPVCSSDLGTENSVA